MLVWALLIETLCFLEIEFAILGPAVGCPDHAAVVRELVESQNRQRGLLSCEISDVAGVADLGLVGTGALRHGLVIRIILVQSYL